jgi:hypothetical protein
MRLRKREVFALVMVTVATVVAWIHGYLVFSGLQFARILTWLTLGIMLFAGGISAIARWKHDRWRALVVVGLALAAFVLDETAFEVGMSYRDRQFLNYMAPYQQLVDDFQSGRIPPGRLRVDSLPPSLRNCCYVVWGSPDSTGVWQVEFVWGWGFPTHHVAWVYSSGTSRATVMARGEWYYAYQLVPHWYRAID